MRTRTANWFVCRIGYEKTMEDGTWSCNEEDE